MRKENNGSKFNIKIDRDKLEYEFGEFLFKVRQKWKKFRNKHLVMDYTVMLIPHANSKPVNLKMPVGVILGILIGVFVLLGCTTYFAYQSYHLHMVAAENTGLKKISQKQADQLETLTAMSDDMMDQLADLYKRDAKLRKKLKMSTDKDNKGGYSEEIALHEKKYTYKSSIFDSGDKSLSKDLNMLYTKLDILNKYIEAENALYEEISDKTAARVKKEKCLPTRWPVKGGNVSSYFGYRSNPFGGYSGEFHDAIDISCAAGTPIYAAGQGKVIKAEYDAGYGRCIQIDHGYGYVTRYSHCSDMFVDVGDKVKANQKIGTVGTTGRATGPHLDFQVIHNGEPIDPLSMLN